MAKAGDIGTRTRSMFAIIPTDTLRSVATRGRMRRFPKGCVLMRQGEFADAMYVITKGVVDVVQMGADGQRTHLALLGEGEVVGEMGVLSGHARNATVVAVNDVETLRIPREDVLRGLLDVPGLPQPLRLHLMRRLDQPAPAVASGLVRSERWRPLDERSFEEEIARW